MGKWEKPVLNMLDVSMTKEGPHDVRVDATYSDQDETVDLHGS